MRCYHSCFIRDDWVGFVQLTRWNRVVGVHLKTFELPRGLTGLPFNLKKKGIGLVGSTRFFETQGT